LKCIDAVKAYWQSGGRGIAGLHLEGPWLNPGKRGAHVEALIHPPAIEEIKELLDYGRQVIKMITIAPEVCNDEIIELLLANNIILSAGHSNATYEQARKAFSKGVGLVTHLYNAMSALQHRAPGLVGAAFDDPTVSASIIPDGHHSDWAAVRIASKIMGDRLFAITDAVTETETGYYHHKAAGDKYESAGVLSGSSLSMAKALYNLVHHCDISIDLALRMCSWLPAKAVGIGNRYGRIDAGYCSGMVVLNRQTELIQTIN
jgi:N-acetylglucosamine-6-phosphate deacetylase